MKKLNFLSIAVLSCTVSAAFCQNSATPPPESSAKKVRITDASVIGGFTNQSFPVAGSLADFKKLNPQSQMLNEDLTGYAEGSNWFGVHSTAFTGGLFGASLGLNLKEKPKSLIQLRCGISVSGLSINNHISKTRSVPYDTLTSSQTGQAIYYDSTTISGYSMNYTAQQLHLDFSLIYRLYPSARWSLYGGVGISGGASLMAYSDIRYNEISFVETGAEPRYYGESVYRTERIQNRGVQEYIGYLPVGVDFRMGKRKEFFKQIHLFSELRPFVSIVNTKELGTFAGTGLKNVFGIRVTI